VSASTSSTGGFSLTVSLPPNGCTIRQCTYYYGPYAPLSYSLQNGTSAGYFVDGNETGTTMHVGIVEAFGRLAIAPGGTRVVSVGAPTRFAAQPLAADGTPSPVPFAYAWSVANGGWNVSPSLTNATIQLTAQAGASPTLLHLSANGSYGGAPFSGQTSESVAAVATTLSVAQAVPTSVDEGMWVNFSATGAGALAYNYTATVSPGLGEPSIQASCRTTPIQGGEASLSCSVRFAYGEAGTAAPTITLTNGYSSAERAFPPVVVARGLAIRLAPSLLATYAGQNLIVVASIVNGTGTSPYGPACFHPGDGNPICLTSPGPSWTYAVAYPSPGSYPASEVVGDAAGADATLAANVTVAVRPSLSPISASTQVVEVGGTVSLRASLAGGVGPVAFWWNETLPNGTLARGTVPASGLLSETFAPTIAGHDAVELTCVDALGTPTTATIDLTAEPGPAVALDLAAGGSLPSTGTAGVPIRIDLDATAPGGGRVPDYASSLTIAISGPAPGDGVWLNGSVGSLPSAGGEFSIPVDAWYGGYLNFSITGVIAGRYTVKVTAPLPAEFGASGSFSIAVGANAARLVLVDPVVAASAPRSGSTEYVLRDVFANPAPAGIIFVHEEFGPSPVKLTEPILLGGNVSRVWVNWSAPTPDAGTVVVTAAAGELLLGPIEVAAAPASSDVTLGIAVGSLLGIAAVGTGLLLIRRGGSRRSDGGAELASPEVTEEELRRGAEGREQLLERIRTDGPLDLAGIRTGWPAPAPSPAELAEWLAGLVTEGAVATELGAGGTPVYRIRSAPAPEDVPRLRVQTDPAALERALSAADRPDEPDAASNGK
jgi:hypothetical protein